MPEGDPSNAFERSAGDVEASWFPGWLHHAGGRFQPADLFNRLPGRKETR